MISRVESLDISCHMWGYLRRELKQPIGTLFKTIFIYLQFLLNNFAEILGQSIQQIFRMFGC